MAPQGSPVSCTTKLPTLNNGHAQHAPQTPTRSGVADSGSVPSPGESPKRDQPLKKPTSVGKKRHRGNQHNVTDRGGNLRDLPPASRVHRTRRRRGPTRPTAGDKAITWRPEACKPGKAERACGQQTGSFTPATESSVAPAGLGTLPSPPLERPRAPEGTHPTQPTKATTSSSSGCQAASCHARPSGLAVAGAKILGHGKTWQAKRSDFESLLQREQRLLHQELCAGTRVLERWSRAREPPPRKSDTLQGQRGAQHPESQAARQPEETRLALS